MEPHRMSAIYYDHGLLAWIIIGLIAGWLSGTVTRGRGFGCFADTILGMVGALIGGWIFSKLGITTFGFFGSLAAAFVGAVVLVAIARLFAGSRN
ncbi:MAG TPA: GlsB/YeaQ/YmgE family stress response membrane protein [Candidatus Dormibacteraeota bacterium]|nr:GlsB/YeaQ/YmgE family stress response membrane protein [Candidatus Dormibacteraeota bacterium]